jgi:hypothetical protein
MKRKYFVVSCLKGGKGKLVSIENCMERGGDNEGDVERRIDRMSGLA